MLRRLAFALLGFSLLADPAAARGGGGAVQAVHWRWTQGLPPALGVQAETCPAGTMATLAEGHENIVRCIPL